MLNMGRDAVGDACLIYCLFLLQVLSAIGGLIVIAGRFFYAIGYYTGGLLLFISSLDYM